MKNLFKLLIRCNCKKDMKTLNDVLAEVQSAIAGLQTVAIDVQSLIDAQQPTPVDNVIEVDLKRQSGAVTTLPVNQS